jgi:hypothetical protein
MAKIDPRQFASTYPLTAEERHSKMIQDRDALAEMHAAMRSAFGEAYTPAANHLTHFRERFVGNVTIDSTTGQLVVRADNSWFQNVLGHGIAFSVSVDISKDLYLHCDEPVVRVKRIENDVGEPRRSKTKTYHFNTAALATEFLLNSIGTIALNSPGETTK